MSWNLLVQCSHYIHLWCRRVEGNIHVWFGDNHSVRYGLIKSSGAGVVLIALLRFHFGHEAN